MQNTTKSEISSHGRAFGWQRVTTDSRRSAHCARRRDGKHSKSPSGNACRVPEAPCAAGYCPGGCERARPGRDKAEGRKECQGKDAHTSREACPMIGPWCTYSSKCADNDHHNG
uniref:Uncharacterized protein n=1 Tax=Anopheles atroparvus TaxID=41427 RepID=A0AAG5DGQ2_ANOAO